MLITKLSRMWEEEKLKAMSTDKSFAQEMISYKGQEGNEIVARGRSGI